jgi:hypothetical protein
MDTEKPSKCSIVTSQCGVGLMCGGHTGIRLNASFVLRRASSDTTDLFKFWISHPTKVLSQS